jgi:hypothetical protein
MLTPGDYLVFKITGSRIGLLPILLNFFLRLILLILSNKPLESSSEIELGESLSHAFEEIELDRSVPAAATTIVRVKLDSTARLKATWATTIFNNSGSPATITIVDQSLQVGGVMSTFKIAAVLAIFCSRSATLPSILKEGKRLA